MKRQFSLLLAAGLVLAATSLPAQGPLTVKVGEPFPALTLPSLADGKPLSIASFRGKKVILFEFASW